MALRMTRGKTDGEGGADRDACEVARVALAERVEQRADVIDLRVERERTFNARRVAGAALVVTQAAKLRRECGCNL